MDDQGDLHEPRQDHPYLPEYGMHRETIGPDLDDYLRNNDQYYSMLHRAQTRIGNARQYAYRDWFRDQEDRPVYGRNAAMWRMRWRLRTSIGRVNRVVNAMRMGPHRHYEEAQRWRRNWIANYMRARVEFMRQRRRRTREVIRGRRRFRRGGL